MPTTRARQPAERRRRSSHLGCGAGLLVHHRDATIKYHALGDDYEHSRFIDHGDGFTVWYGHGV